MKDKTTICSLKDDKACAVTFTTDDALYRSCLYYRSRFKELGLRGSLMIPVGFVCPSADKNITEENGFGTWEQWQAFVDEGLFEVENHTVTHPDLSKVSPEQLDAEVNRAREILRNKFPGHKVLCMANPFVITNDEVDAVVRKQHYSARNGGDGFNSLSPSEAEWSRLNFKAALHDSTAKTMNPWIDQAIDGHLWLIEMWHGVDGQSWEPPKSAECGRHLEYLAGKLDVVWNGTMGEVTMYLREKQHASVRTMMQDDAEIHINLTTGLDPDLFDYPLTLRTELPSGWNTVHLSCGKREEKVPVIEKDGVRYAQYNAVPNKGVIMLRRQ